MHLLATTSASLEDLAEPVDLGQTPAEMVALSFTDSDLSGLAAAWRAEAGAVPDMRLAALRDLSHPMSVDLWIDKVASHARIILVRILGGYDWWRYGCDRLSAMARERGIKLALLPGECRDRDERLIAHSTLPEARARSAARLFPRGRTCQHARAGAPAGWPCRPRHRSSRGGAAAEGRVLRSATL